MIPTCFSLNLKIAFLALEAQQVVALRMMRVAAGGAVAEREMRRVVWEKGTAAGEAGLAAFLGMAAGKPHLAVGGDTVKRYQRRVRANRRRLTGR